LIALDDVSKRYPNGTFALRDVDLRVDSGDFIFLVGASGAGKSTLIRLLIREELATTGRVVVDGEDVGRMPRSRVHRLRRKVGVVFQDFKLLPRKTVAENVAFALVVTGHEGRLVREETERALSLVGLTPRKFSKNLRDPAFMRARHGAEGFASLGREMDQHRAARTTAAVSAESPHTFLTRVRDFLRL